MRRLARRLSTVCLAASVLLCTGLCALWVRSYVREGLWTWTIGPAGTRYVFHVSRGTPDRSPECGTPGSPPNPARV